MRQIGDYILLVIYNLRAGLVMVLGLEPLAFRLSTRPIFNLPGETVGLASYWPRVTDSNGTPNLATFAEK